MANILFSIHISKGISLILYFVVNTYLTIFRKADVDKLFVDKKLSEILYNLQSRFLQ